MGDLLPIPIPESMQEIAGIIGEEPTRALMREFCGRPVIFAMMPARLAEVVGPFNAQKLIDSYGMFTKWIPAGWRRRNKYTMQRLMVKTALAEGKHAKEVADLLEITVRRVYQIARNK